MIQACTEQPPGSNTLRDRQGIIRTFREQKDDDARNSCIDIRTP